MNPRDRDIGWQFPLPRKDRKQTAIAGALYLLATVAAVLLLVLFR